MLNLTEASSDISRTNQLKIDDTLEEVAEKLFQYLFKLGKGIDHFSIKGWSQKDEDSSSDYYQSRHKYIKVEIKKRLAEYGEAPEYADIQYFYSRTNSVVFFLSPNNKNSGWKELFITKYSTDRERIFNLIFKVYILSQTLPTETIRGFEELLLTHQTSPSKTKDALFVWGQNVYVHFNYHNVLTLSLSRKLRMFLPQDKFTTVDGDDLGEMQVYQNKKYYYKRDLDARRKNYIYFMRFDDVNPPFEKFKKTQVYYYHKLMTYLENFLRECDIPCTRLDFQTNFFLEDPFVDSSSLEFVKSLRELEIINNTGTDLSDLDKLFLQNFLFQQGIITTHFFNSGKTISRYELCNCDSDEDSCWRITEVVPWSSIELSKNQNYLVFNRLLEEEDGSEDSGSMAYQRQDGLWIASSEIEGKEKVDFYSSLKRRANYLETGDFISIQGINLSGFVAVGNEEDQDAVLKFPEKKVDKDKDALLSETREYTDGQLLEVKDSIYFYLMRQTDHSLWEKFVDNYRIKISPEFTKVLIELGIKSWIRESMSNPTLGLPITKQPFAQKQFYTIYVRTRRNQEARAVAVKFLYEDGAVFIQDIVRGTGQVTRKFPFLKRSIKSNELINNQQYFVDEENQTYISCYTSDDFTPTLIGRNGILEEAEAGTLKIDRQAKEDGSARLFPLVSYYSGAIKPINRIQDMICFDRSNDSFIQYYVPSKIGLDRTIKRGFRVYHLIGKTYSGDSIPTSELMENPIVALHFNTLTQNILKISENSQSSLLQKVARVLIEN